MVPVLTDEDGEGGAVRENPGPVLRGITGPSPRVQASATRPSSEKHNSTTRAQQNGATKVFFLVATCEQATPCAFGRQ